MPEKCITDRSAHIRCSISRYAFMERPYYPRKLVLANARSGKTVPTRGSRAGPTTHPHSRIKHKCHLPMPDPHEPRASLLLPLLLLSQRRPVPSFPPFFLLAFSRPLLLQIFLPALVTTFGNFLVIILSRIFFLVINRY